MSQKNKDANKDKRGEEVQYFYKSPSEFVIIFQNWPKLFF